MNKDLTLTSVKHATLLLIEANQQTTTLEVKTVLRNLGYEANQADVSSLMSQAADELPLEFDNNGNHRTYVLPSPAAAVATAVTGNAVPTHATPIAAVTNAKPTSNIVSYTKKRCGSIIVGTRSDVATSVDDWAVGDGVNDTIYFSGSLSRDDVRQAYAGINSVAFGTTRSKRIK